MDRSLPFEKFMKKIKEPILILDNYGKKTVYECLIFGIYDYLKIVSKETAISFINTIKKENNLPEQSFSLGILHNLIELSSNSHPNKNNGIILDERTYIFNEHLEAIKNRKLEINAIINKRALNGEDLFTHQKEMQNLLHESSAVFYFWYLLHQNVETKNNKKYNFFDMQKANSHMPNIKEGFKIQNFDDIQRTEDSSLFFVLSMIINFADVENDDFDAHFNLVGIYQENNTLHCYRYELKRGIDLANFNFFNAIEMLAN